MSPVAVSSRPDSSVAHSRRTTWRDRSPRAARFVAALAAISFLVPLVAVPRPAAAATSAYANAILGDRPAAYLRLGETSGAVARDATGNNSGTYRNAPGLGQGSLLASDTTNTSVSFDGVADDVAIPSSAALSPSSGVTVEAWIRPASLPAAGKWASIVTKAESYSLQLNGPRLEFTIIQGGVRHRVLAPSGAVAAAGVYHVAGTYDGTRQRLYVNGVKVATNALTGPISRNANKVTIGSWNGSRERFRGRIDEVAVYGHALTGARIAWHTTLSGQAARPRPTASAAPTSSPTGVRTGLAAHFMWQTVTETKADLDRMQAAGMKYVRFDVSWRNSEPTKGTYLYLDKLDQVIAAVQSHGMALTMTVIETPAWANGGKGMFAPPSNMADYARFVGVLAKRYAARSGMVWEIWNEENDPHFWTTGPSASQYAGMLKAAYPAIKAADPDATVLTGGILYNHTAFLEGLYSAGAGNSFDGLAIHPYAKGYAPGSTADPYFSFKSSVPQFTKVLTNHSQGSKRIWITEMGWSSSVVTDATRATYLKDAVAIARTWTNVAAMGAYTLHQSQFPTYGLLTVSGAPTLSWTAYASAQ